MKVYIYLKDDYDNIDDPERKKNFETIRKYPELVQYNESISFYWCDIKFIRKLKLSTIEKSKDYSDIIKILFNPNLVEFLEHPPKTNGYSGRGR